MAPTGTRNQALFTVALVRWSPSPAGPVSVGESALDFAGNAVMADAVLVERVAVEVSWHVTAKPYPESTAGRREVPLPPLVQRQLARHRNA